MEATKVRPSPAWNAAFVFSQFTPGEVTYIPTAGLDFKFGGEQGGRDLVDYIGLTFGYSVGFPYSSFEVRSGHDRYSRWETVRIEEWDGFGLRHGPHIGIKIGNADFLASYFRENYDPKFLGEDAKVDMEGFSFFLNIDF